MIPTYTDKYEADGVFAPEDAMRAQGDGLPDLPSAVILGYQRETTETAEELAHEETELVRSQRVLDLGEGVGYVPVHEAGVGAPVSATVIENLVAAGVEVVVLLGGSAGLQPELSPDTVVLPTSAIRDEGVSYHYLPPEASVTPTDALVDHLDEALAAAAFDTARGPTWTTSAMYRETEPEVDHYAEEGVVSLGMEPAAIWAVCEYREVDTATVHEIGDVLTVDEWLPETDSTRGLAAILDPTVTALRTYLEDRGYR